MKDCMKCFLIAGTVLLISGCGKQGLPGGRFSRLPGDPIVFRVSSNQSSTRTEYRAGTYGDGEIWPIDWVTGDMLRIYSPDTKRASWDQPEQWADYKIKTVTPDGVLSKGTLENVQPVGLAWGDAGTNHTFYAIYPSPTGADEDLVNDGKAGIFPVTIPGTQAMDSQMAYAAMTAAASASNGSVSDDAVTLMFYPACTAFEFEIRCEMNGVVLNEIGIETASASTNPVSGSVKVTAPLAGGIPAVTAIVTAGDKVALPLTEGVTLSTTTPVKLRILAMPNDLKDLKLWVKRSFDGVTVTNKLALKYATGEFMTFTGGRYHRIKGIVTPSTFEIITVNGEDIDWDIQAEGESLIWD